MTSPYATAWNDIRNGFAEWEIWGRLGWQEVKRRYHRTVLGPFWATLSIGMFIGGMAFIWAPLFNSDVSSYLPYLSAGLVTWTFLVSLITEGCATYTAGVALITQLSFPYTLLTLVVIWRNIIVLFHHLLIVIIVVAIFSVPVSWHTLLLIPGVALVAINGGWIGILLGMLSARFRDVPPLVGNLLQVLMFATPVFWMASQLSEGRRRYVIDMNFIYHLVDVMRAPMLGEVPSALSYKVTIAGAVIGWIVTFVLYSRYRQRIAYWL